MNRKKLVILFIFTICFIFVGMYYFAGSVNIEISKIQYIYYSSSDSTKGKEITSWGDENIIDGKPSEFDLFVTLRNPYFLSNKPSKLQVEFWLAKAKNIFTGTENFSENLKKIRSDSEWSLLWKKELELNEFKPFEVRKIKVERVKISELIENEYYKDAEKGLNNLITAWRSQVVCGKSQLKKDMMIEIIF